MARWFHGCETGQFESCYDGVAVPSSGRGGPNHVTRREPVTCGCFLRSHEACRVGRLVAGAASERCLLVDNLKRRSGWVAGCTSGPEGPA